MTSKASRWFSSTVNPISAIWGENVPDIVWFSRGRGRGHATRDLAIVQQLRAMRSDIRILFISYATGLAALRRGGETVIDLGLPEANSFPETVVRATQLLSICRPKLVVAQEELAALSAAKILNLPRIFETHWFPSRRHPNFLALGHADHVIFMEEKDIFEEPECVRGKVYYSGPVLRKFYRDPGSRDELRSSLSLGPHDLAVMVAPGSFPERKSPLYDLVIDAVQRIDSYAVKRIFWSAGNDFDFITSRQKMEENIEIVTFYPDMDKMLISCDVVITKGTYNIGREAMAFGIPSMSISFSNNYVDDIYSKIFPTNRCLLASSTNPNSLSRAIEQSARCPRPIPDNALLDCNGAHRVAAHLLEILDSLAN